jgi:dipeptidyl aminopeptidase/acylaminoacyl peptidase
LTPDNGDRYADLTRGPGGELWCVRERHHDGAVSRAIVAVSLDGEIRELVTGSDFFAHPTPSPDGRRIAWIDWDHPRMPWDGAALRVALLADAPVRTTDVPALLGGPEESAIAPVWLNDEQLYGISDISGWWNLYLLDAAGLTAPRPLCPRDEEFAAPLWQLGTQPFAVLDDGRLAVLHGRGENRLAILDPATGKLTDLDLPYRHYLGVSASGSTVASVTGGPADPWSVISVDTADGSSRVLYAASAPAVDHTWLPEPVPLSIEQNGGEVHALVYPPTSPEVQAPEGERPPFVVRVHGGPTSYSPPVLELSRAYFTSRGIGVVELNYGGSSGYGRPYRERLRGQ